ncbi:hypothetical protein F2Q70_00011589 [Brassica cretica]|uniref:Uncharacterized protein n=2 Tax=Brassica cretica TaxID=69181 RepID=A0A8S9MAM5_BRACR|nr:hypothetical protein F2Q70_00011589 [Brassica cretica]
MPFTNLVIFSSREFRPPEKLEMANLLSDEPTTNSIMKKFVTVHERPALRRPHKIPNRRCKEQFKSSRDEADQRRCFLQFDVQKFCDNFEKEMMKALRDVRKIQKKSTTTHAHVAEPSLFISEKPKGKSENNLEDLKKNLNSLPIFDEYDEELLESLIICEDECDLPSPKSDFMFDDEETNGLTCFEREHPSSRVLVSQDLEEEPFDYPHQGPLLDTRRPMDGDLGPIFDEEDELGQIFNEEARSLTSINMENHLCFVPGTTPTPLSKNIQEHCEKLDLINSLPKNFAKISSQDVKHFGFDKVKQFCVSNSVFENIINSFKLIEPVKLFDQKRFQNGNNIHSDLVLSFDQFLKHSKGFDHLEKSLEIDLQQPVFCARKSFDSFVFKENGFNLNSYRHALVTGNLFASTCALDEFMVKTLLEQKSPRDETDFCDFVLKFDILHDLKMLNIISCFDTILVCNAYFGVHFERLKRVLHVLGKETLISDLNKYISCTYDPGILMFVLSVQDKQVQPQKSESIDHAHQHEIWRCMYSRDGAAHGCRRDDHISSQWPRKLDDQFNSNQVYDDCEESMEPREKPQPIPCESQKHCKDHELIVYAHYENVLNTRISMQKQIFTWYKNILLKSFHELFSLSCALKETRIWRKHESKLLRLIMINFQEKQAQEIHKGLMCQELGAGST